MKCNIEKRINEVQNRKNLVCEGGIIIFQQIIQEIEKDMDKFEKENPNRKRETMTFGVLDFLDKLRRLRKNFVEDMGLDEEQVIKWLKQNDVID